MNVHIVCKRWQDSDKIVPRLARNLAERTGWSLSDKYSETADVNYAMVYLMGYGTTEFDLIPGKKGAWFSHYPLSQKRRKWNLIRDNSDFATVCVDEYYKMLLPFIRAYKVTPGIDQNFFNPVGRVKWSNLIGTAGYVTEGDRKGPDLAHRLHDHFGAARFTTIGRGWHHPSVEIPYIHLPQWYRSIDVFVSTSRVEGIGMPPIEALACGTKVVVPRGVGIFDELPEMAGIRHYEMGNIRDCIRAVEHAARDVVKREDLRNQVSKYTYDAWADSHIDVMKSILGVENE